MKTYSVGIVGLGQVGIGYDLEGSGTGNILTHAKAFDVHDQFNIECGIDSSSTARKLFSNTYNKISYSTIEEAFDHCRPDILIIATPTKTHLPIIRRLLSIYSPKAMLCEKPLAYNLDDAKTIVQACKSAGSKLFVNYMRRADSASLTIKDMIEKGIFASPIKGFCYYSKGLFHNGSHFINLLEFWLGCYKSHIVCDRGRYCSKDDCEPDFYISFENGDVAFHAAWEEEFSHYTIELLSKAGRIRYDHGGYLVQFQGLASDPDFPSYRVLSQHPIEIPNSMSQCQLRVAESLFNAMNGEESSLCTGHEALKTLESIGKVVNSLGSRQDK